MSNTQEPNNDISYCPKNWAKFFFINTSWELLTFPKLGRQWEISFSVILYLHRGTFKISEFGVGIYLLFSGNFTWVWCFCWKIQYFLHWMFGSFFTYSKILFILLSTSAPWFCLFLLGTVHQPGKFGILFFFLLISIATLWCGISLSGKQVERLQIVCHHFPITPSSPFSLPHLPYHYF